MAPGGEIFKQEKVAFEQTIKGTVNGKVFKITGKGRGDASIGKLKGKWVLSSPRSKEGEPPAECPMAWGVLAPTFAYGFKCYAKYPDDDKDAFQWFQRCFQKPPAKGGCYSAGYSQRRITKFSRMSADDDEGIDKQEGIMRTFHELVLQEGMAEGELAWIVKNTVTLEATINEGSPLLKNDGADIFLQSLERTVPFEDGVKNYVQYFYPIKDSEEGDIIIATQMTHNRPHCKSCCGKISENRFVHNKENNCLGPNPIPLPKAHFKRTECKQWRDPNETRDHVLQDEINVQFSFAHEGDWTKIGMDDEENTDKGDVSLGSNRKDI